MLEQSFAAFSGALQDPLVLVRADGRIVAANDAAVAVVGTPGERSLYELVTAQESLQENLRLFSRSSSPLSCSVELHRADGTRAVYRCDGARVGSDGDSGLLMLRLRPRMGAATGFLELNRRIDQLARVIHERERAETLLEGQMRALELIARDAPLSDILETLVVTIETVTPPIRGSILLLEGTTLRHGAAPNLPPAYNQAIDGVAIGPSVGSCGTAAFTGEPVIVTDIATDPLWADFRDLAMSHGLRACWSTPIRSTAGRVLGTFAMYDTVPREPTPRELSVIAMVTGNAAIAIERKLAEEERARLLASERAAREEAERANRLKDEFLAIMSHELRTPLTSVIGWTRLLLQDAPQGSLREALETIDRSARAQARLVDDLLDVSRIASGRQAIERIGVDLAGIVRDVVVAVTPQADAAEIAVTTDLAEDAGPLLGDPQRLRQVVWNLLVNAIKFGHKGGSVKVSLARDGGWIRLTVADDGEGISPEFLPSIFDRFSQADLSMRRRRSGLGLGLSIVQDFVELHGGSITAQSDGEGKGATFTVLLPAAPTPLLAGAVRQDEAGSLSGRRLAGATVLLVEDETASRDVLRYVLEASGATVQIAVSGEDALQKFAASPPDLLVSDIAMPDMDGYALIGRIRAAENGGRATPAVAVTAFARPEDRDRALRSGFQLHVAKPLDPTAFVVSLQELLRGPSAHISG